MIILQKLVPVALCAVGTGCGSASHPDECSGLGSGPLIVYVEDAATGSPICSATVTAEAPGVPPTTLKMDKTPQCPYVDYYGAGDTSYTVTVQAAGYAPVTSPSIHVPNNSCGQPVPQEYTVKLTPK